MKKWLIRIVGIFLLTIVVIVGTFLAFIKLDTKDYVVPILMYHSINYAEPPAALITSPELFDWQMAYLKDHGFQVISMDELVEGITNKKKFSKKTAVLTFDDGFEDNYTYAFKTLKKYGFPATFYVPSEEIGREGRLSIDQLKEMVAAGFDIGGHARLVDSYLPGKTSAELYQEVVESKQNIEQRLGVDMEHFAYPIGGFNDEIKKLVKQAGFDSASTTNRGFDQFNQDVYELNRIRLSDKDNKGHILWIKLTGYYNMFRKPKNPY